MTKEEILKLPVLDQLKYLIEESLKDHKGFNSEYWKGSAFMGGQILQTIEQVKGLNKTSVINSACGAHEHYQCEFRSKDNECKGNCDMKIN